MGLVYMYAEGKKFSDQKKGQHQNGKEKWSEQEM
jgi:hypothetical protein